MLLHMHNGIYILLQRGLAAVMLGPINTSYSFNSIAYVFLGGLRLQNGMGLEGHSNYKAVDTFFVPYEVSSYS